MKNGKIKPRVDRPRHSFMNRWRLMHPVAPDTEYSNETVKFLSHEVRLKRHDLLTTRSFNLFLYPNEAAIRFRLDIPVREQIEMARQHLTAAVREYRKTREAAAHETRALLAAHANSKHSGKVSVNAHYWLRCYDAEHEPKRSSGNRDARREQESGPGARKAQFNAEEKAAGRQNRFDIGAVKGFLDQARDFIDGRKFLLLMTSGPKRKTKTSTRD